ARTGIEKVAFIPKEVLPNRKAYYKDARGGPKTYGKHGQINLWVEFEALDADSQTRTLSEAYLHAGLAPGGRDDDALDVTNLDAPRLKWVIKGGVPPGFEKLG